MKARFTRTFAPFAVLAALPVTHAMAQAPAPATTAAMPASSGEVTAVYARWKLAPMWFRGSIPTPAAAKLIGILKRAPFDGFASGPTLAAQVDSAIAQAASGDPARIKAADQALSTAWVLYVQALKRPTPGMIYAYKMMEPQGTRTDQIVLTAAASAQRSLEQHLDQVSNLNSIYTQIRDTAYAQALASGSMVPDQRLIANLDRARSIPGGGKFILVDAASQQMTLYDNNVPIDSMKVIVGTDETPTPMIASVMHYITFNPYWNAPENLVRKAIAPNAASQGEAYLKSRGYEVMSDWTDNATVIPASQVDWKAVAAGRTKIRVRQLPGQRNFMGDFKFSFPNGQDIFLHDTPTKSLFKQSDRSLSNGCVRLEDAQRFGRWLLGRDPVAPSATPEQHVQLPQGVPIVMTYLTAQPKEGKLTYLKDVYGWDSSPAAALAAASMVARD